jgi:hypothetical protein
LRHVQLVVDFVGWNLESQIQTFYRGHSGSLQVRVKLAADSYRAKLAVDHTQPMLPSAMAFQASMKMRI